MSRTSRHADRDLDSAIWLIGKAELPAELLGTGAHPDQSKAGGFEPSGDPIRRQPRAVIGNGQNDPVGGLSQLKPGAGRSCMAGASWVMR